MALSGNPAADPQAVVSGPQYRFTVLTDRLLRYEWAPDGDFEERASTLAINRRFPVPQFRVFDGDELEIITDHFRLTYDKKKFSPAGLTAHFKFRHTLWGAPWEYGVAEENLGGTARTLDLCDGRCDMGPGIMSRAGFASLDDSSSALFDGDLLAARKPGERVDGYLFCYGRDYKAAIKAFYALSGKQPLLPRFALGNWWSRYYAYHQDEYVQLVDEFRARDIPLSVAVLDMDWHLVSEECVPHAGWTGYTWSKQLFPAPEDFRREMQRRHLKVTLNDHPHGGIHAHEDAYEEMARALGEDPSQRKPISFDPTSAAFMTAYLEILHRNIEKVACDFWWIDWQQGSHSKIPGVDPLWVLNHRHYVDQARLGNPTPLIFSRYAGPGSHRYPVGFSGDTVVTWDSLAFQPEFTATASNIGYGWWSHDIGGHILGGRDDELVTRWVQLGVFSPIFRLHSTDSRWMSKEPWRYRSECDRVMSEFMRLRHRLVPFLYSRNVICATEDEPLVQPMYWAYPDSDDAYAVPNQYLFGSELLVAPIVQPRDKRTNLGSAKAWLPPGRRYVDLFTGIVYDGDRMMTFHRRLEEYPVLASEGAIIVLDADAAPRNGCLNPTAFEVVVVVGRDARARIVEDVDDATREIIVEFRQAAGKLTMAGMDRSTKFRFLSITSVPRELKVFLDGLDRTHDAKIWVDTGVSPGLIVECPFEGGHLLLDLGSNPPLSVMPPTCRLESLIMDYQTEFAVKDKLWEAARKPNTAVSTLLSLGYDEGIVGPVIELLLADTRLHHEGVRS